VIITKKIPPHARVIVVGGGVIGTSVAYHLTELGCKDVLLLERDRLTSGSTWHAAGLIASGGMQSETSIWAMRYSRDLYASLETKTGHATGFEATGYLQLATTRARRQALGREAAFMRGFGVDKQEISPGEVKRRVPLLRTDDVVAGFLTADEGRANPVDVTMSLAAGARLGGATLLEGVPITSFKIDRGRVTGVSTALGDVTAELVVICAGMWTRQLAALAGVSVPLQAAEHYYMVTEPFAGANSDWPVVEDPDRFAYFRAEGGGLLIGLFEPSGATWKPAGIPEDASFCELPPDWDRVMPFLDAAIQRVPALREVGIKKLFCGPESFTPDAAFLLGETPEVRNLFVAAGMNSMGILAGGGVGALMAEWILDGQPSHDVSGLSIARTMPFESTRAFLAARTPELLGYMFAYSAFPTFEFKTARNVRRSCLHESLKALGAHFGVSHGWETPLWFSPDGSPTEVALQFDRQSWFGFAASEHHAVRNGIGLFDASPMAKFLVQGRDAQTVLNRLSANNVAVPIGRNVYTQWLNGKAGIVADITVTRLGQAEFLIVASDVIHRSTETWLRRHILSDEFCTVTDVTSAYCILSLQGPQSRLLLAGLTPTDLSTGIMPFRAAQQIELGYARFWSIRLTYVGELGYELYVPTEHALCVYEALVMGAKELGFDLRHCGAMSLNSLRLEKAYRDYGHDIDNGDTPLEAGLSFAVDFDKPGGFIGRDALLAQRESGPLKRRLVQFLLQDPDPLLHGGEPIFRDGEWAGYVRAGAYGHTLGGAVALGFVGDGRGLTSDLLNESRFEIEVDGIRYPAKPSLAPLFDPKSERVRV
jgi:glycine cleavage system aminomethyltransferase T/glycine/D-amino acid oxidase-like deaminating enzyme